MDRVADIRRDQPSRFEPLQLGVRDPGAGGGGHGHPAGQEMLMQLGAAGDGQQRRLVGCRKRSATGRLSGACGGLDRLQGGDHSDRGSVAFTGGLLQLMHRAVDPSEQGGVDGELAAGEPVQDLSVKGHAGLGLGQLAVQVHQTCVRLVEDAAVAIGPEGVYVVAGHGLYAAVE
ncbi:hypothetical protein [Streptomyces ipomoeae]|jgi:hypothetical protein|uniref:hypothetical protein n=1 Tax=Streptomyces ipomoeae TaxID=103232 RepID=UPI0029C9C3CE|nr:hypothetical protein [Streptomyces ipomoeae]